MKERRKQQVESMQQRVNLLSNAQHFALGELTHDGGELAFTRQCEDGHIAFVQIEGRLVTIDRQGVVDQHPKLAIRKGSDVC